MTATSLSAPGTKQAWWSTDRLPVASEEPEQAEREQLWVLLTGERLTPDRSIGRIEGRSVGVRSAPGLIVSA
jgi:hypothetical protein